MGISGTLFRPGLVPYEEASRLQQRFAARVGAGAPPTLILLEHPPTYTLGARARPEHVHTSEEALRVRGATVCRTDRGGGVTFHGPGQIVAYPILNLRQMGRGPRSYVHALEAVMLEALDRFGIEASRSRERPGVWVGSAKIAAIGVRVAGGITTHGFALNVNTELSYFDQIIPCGLIDATATSMQQLAGVTFLSRHVEDALVRAFSREFGLSFTGMQDEPSRVPTGAMATVGR